jgi:hypothetical protein
MSENNPKAYWSLVDELRDLNRHESNTNPDSNISSDEWINHYNSLISGTTPPVPRDLLKELNEMKSELFFSELDFKITEEEVCKAIKSIKNGKTAGPDRISNEMIETSSPFLLQVFIKLFNGIVLTGLYPKAWSPGYVTNIYKDGDRSNPGNYKGITVNNCLSKVFSIILNNRLVTYLEKNKTLNPYQIGFKRGARTSDHMFIIRTLLEKYVKSLHIICMLHRFLQSIR